MKSKSLIVWLLSLLLLLVLASPVLAQEATPDPLPETPPIVVEQPPAAQPILVEITVPDPNDNYTIYFAGGVLVLLAMLYVLAQVTGASIDKVADLAPAWVQNLLGFGVNVAWDQVQDTPTEEDDIWLSRLFLRAGYVRVEEPDGSISWRRPVPQG